MSRQKPFIQINKGEQLSDNLKLIQETDKIFEFEKLPLGEKVLAVVQAETIGRLEEGKMNRIEEYNPIPFAKKLVCTDGLTRQEWLGWRQKGVGGSDIASVCGINPWSSPLAVYYSKIEKVPELEAENLPAELGIFLEPFIKVKFEKWFKENEGLDMTVLPMPYILQHPKNPIALANLDGHFSHPRTGDWTIVEFKTTSERNYQEWADGSLPDYYYLQIQWYLYVTNVKKCYLAFLIGNNKFNVTVIERNEEVIEMIVKKVAEFWTTFVEKKVAPAPTGDVSSKEILDKMYENVEVGKEILIEDVKYQMYCKEIADLKKRATEIEKDLEQHKQWIKEKMGTAETGICGEWKITWKEQEKKEFLVKASKFRVLRIKKDKGGI